jgi:hypothetical protein
MKAISPRNGEIALGDLRRAKLRDLHCDAGGDA